MFLIGVCENIDFSLLTMPCMPASPGRLDRDSNPDEARALVPPGIYTRRLIFPPGAPYPTTPNPRLSGYPTLSAKASTYRVTPDSSTTTITMSGTRSPGSTHLRESMTRLKKTQQRIFEIQSPERRTPRKNEEKEPKGSLFGKCPRTAPL
jgi:hypothetical protein